MHNLVDLVCRDARPEGRRSNVQHLSRQPAHLAHAVLRLGVQLRDLVGPDERPPGFRNAIFGIIGVRYGLGHLALRGERVDGPERAGEVEGRERIEVAGFWVWVRNGLGRDEVAQNTVLLLVRVLVRRLAGFDVSTHHLGSGMGGVADPGVPNSS